MLTLLLLTISDVTADILQLGSAFNSKIKPYETQIIKHSTEGGLHKLFYFQCAGSADFTMVSESENKIIESYKDFVSKSSGDCENTYSCFADPCNVTLCAAYPTAECTSNYCNGCAADYSVGGTPVDCNEVKKQYSNRILCRVVSFVTDVKIILKFSDLLLPSLIVESISRSYPLNCSSFCHICLEPRHDL
eukprot:sb/3471103/